MKKRIINDDVFTVVGLRASDPFSFQESAKTPDFILQSREHEQLKELRSVYVADPFVYCDKHGFEHLFFESLNTDGKGVIGKAKRRSGESSWGSFQIVLEEEFHLSYPIITEYLGQIYMTVESAEVNDVRAYISASDDLISWHSPKTLIQGEYYDPTPFEHEGVWYMYAASEKDFSTLNLFVSRNGLLGEWKSHPQSPLIVNDKGNVRPAGPVLTFEGKKYRLAQDCSERYGAAVNVYKITSLSEVVYEEGAKQVLLQGVGSGWNACGMHHLQIYKSREGYLYAVSDGYEKIKLDL